MEEKSKATWRKVLHVALVIAGFVAWAYYWDKKSAVPDGYFTVRQSHGLLAWDQWLALAVIACGLTIVVLRNRRKGG